MSLLRVGMAGRGQLRLASALGVNQLASALGVNQLASDLGPTSWHLHWGPG